MANLKEDSAWVDGIYQLETSDPVQGGPDGVDNVQAKQLGSRTRYLKDRVDATDKRVDAMGQTVAGLGTDKLPVAGGTLKGVLLGKLGAIAPNNPQGAGYGFDGDADSGMFSPKDGLVQIGAQGIAHFETRGTDTYVGPNVAGGNLVLVAGADGRAVVTSEGRMLIGSWNSDGVSRLQVTGSARADGFVSDALDAGGAHFRARNGDYGAFLRNDGTNVYLLSTKKGDPSGQFNDYRPFAWNLSTGYVTIDANGKGTTIGGNATIVGDAWIANGASEGRARIGPLNGYFYSNALSVGWWSPTIGSFQYMVDDRSFRIDGKPVWHSGNVTPLDASKGGVMSGSVTFAAGQRLFLDEGSPQAAKAAATSRLETLNRHTSTSRLTMRGRADLSAEKTIALKGFKEGVDGEFLIEAVEHTFASRGWITVVTLNGGNKGKAKVGHKKKSGKKIDLVVPAPK